MIKMVKFQKHSLFSIEKKVTIKTELKGHLFSPNLQLTQRLDSTTNIWSRLLHTEKVTQVAL